MLHLFEYDTLILLNTVKTSTQVEKVDNNFRYPLYGKESKTIFLLHYKTIKNNWLPPAHQELFEKIILNGFNYPLDNITAYNVQEIIQNTNIHFTEQPDAIFYMDNKLPESIEKWLIKQNIDFCKVRYLPSLTQMIENEKFKRTAWNEIQNYKKLNNLNK